MAEKTLTREPVQKSSMRLVEKMKAVKSENPDNEDFLPAPIGVADEINDSVPTITRGRSNRSSRSW